MGADRVAAIFFGAHWVRKSPRHVLEVIGQCFSIAQANMSCLWQSYADLLVEPDVSAYGFDDFQKALGIVQVGYEAGLKVLPTFRAWAAERDAYNRYVSLERAEKVPVTATPAIVQQPVPLG
jgi:hypothetical protein